MVSGGWPLLTLVTPQSFHYAIRTQNIVKCNGADQTDQTTDLIPIATRLLRTAKSSVCCLFWPILLYCWFSALQSLGALCWDLAVFMLGLLVWLNWSFIVPPPFDPTGLLQEFLTIVPIHSLLNPFVTKCSCLSLLPGNEFGTLIDGGKTENNVWPGRPTWYGLGF